MATTIKDVAHHAGVSISTVSRVLNRTGPAREDTRRRVMRAVRELQYTPNTSAQNLKIAQTKNIALIVSGMTNPFFSPMIRHIERAVTMRGYSLLIETVEGSQNEVNYALRKIEEQKLRGVIFLGGSAGYSQEDFQRMGDVPRVLLAVGAKDNTDLSLYSSININDTGESRKAIEYLVDLGHREIAFFAKQPFEENTIGYRRMLGYREALEARGLPFDPELVIDCEYQPSSGYTAMRGLMSVRQITALFASADTIAMGAAKWALSQGLHIPGDISIVGFDGIEMGEYYHPSLDSVAQPGSQMAASAVDLLFSLIDGQAQNQHVVLEATLRRRGSCASPCT